MSHKAWEGAQTEKGFVPFNVAGHRRVVGVIGPRAIPWNDTVKKVYEVIESMPGDVLFCSRGTPGVDRIVESACKTLRRSYHKITPAFAPAGYDWKGRARWWAIRHLLLPIKVWELVVFLGRKPDYWLGRIIKSAEAKGVPIVKIGDTGQLGLFAPIPKPLPLKKRPLNCPESA